MLITVATYEHAAARHLIDDWRASMGPRIAFWLDWKGIEMARIDGDKEWLYILPVVDGRLAPVLLAEVIKNCHVERFDKLLHFGKVPTKNSQWRLLMEMIK